MTRYVISFPSAAMEVPPEELEAVGRAARAVIADAKAAGVYVFAGGVDESRPPALVSTTGACTEGGHPGVPPLTGGFTVLDLASWEEALQWAGRLAQACRCDQAVRVFGEDPEA